MTTLLWLFYFLIPSEGGIVNGLPLGPLDTIGVILIVWIAAHKIRVPGSWLAVGIAVAAAIMTAAVPGEGGVHARYFANADASGAHERSIEYRDPDFTRVDSRLDFTRGRHDFPLSFFNDHTRFNFMRMGEPDRKYLAFAAAWTGWWWSDGDTTLFLHSPQASAQIAIDTVVAVRTTPATSDQQARASLTRGWHRLHVTLSSPYGASREFAAGAIHNGGHVAFSATDTRTEHIDSRQMVVASILTTIKPLADIAVFGWLATFAGLLLIRRAGELWQRRAASRAAFAMFMLVATAEALRFAWPWAERLRLMAAGDDTMVYEGYARDILFRGILMNGGGPLGSGEPFYFQALYPYFLAASHAIFGESFFGALFLQRCLVAMTAVVLARIAIAIAGTRVWPAALAVSTSFVYWKLAPISGDLLSESLYVPMLAWWALASVELCMRQTPRDAARAGLIGGVTAITRSTSLLAWPFVWGAAFLTLRGKPQRARLITILAAISFAVFSLIAIRNALVSYRFAPMPTEFGITLRAGNEPPGDLVMHVESRKWLYNLIRADGHTAEVIEYAIEQPGAFGRNMWNKLLFVLGFYEGYAPGWGNSPVYIATWIAALAGLVIMRRENIVTLTTAIPLMIALTQFIAIVIVYPKGERLIVPIHTLLIPYAGIAADRLVRFAIGQPSTGAAPAPPAQLPSSP